MIELKEASTDYIISLAKKYDSIDDEEIIKIVNKHFLFGYEVWKDRERYGVVFALKINGKYSLDGYNEHINSKSFFISCHAGRAVIKRLINEFTNEIFTCHKTANKAATALAERIGFRILTYFDDCVVLKYGGT